MSQTQKQECQKKTVVTRMVRRT